MYSMFEWSWGYTVLYDNQFSMSSWTSLSSLIDVLIHLNEAFLRFYSIRVSFYLWLFLPHPLYRFVALLNSQSLVHTEWINSVGKSVFWLQNLLSGAIYLLWCTKRRGHCLLIIHLRDYSISRLLRLLPRRVRIHVPFTCVTWSTTLLCILVNLLFNALQNFLHGIYYESSQRRYSRLCKCLYQAPPGLLRLQQIYWSNYLNSTDSIFWGAIIVDFEEVSRKLGGLDWLRSMSTLYDTRIWERGQCARIILIFLS